MDEDTDGHFVRYLKRHPPRIKLDRTCKMWVVSHGVMTDAYFSKWTSAIGYALDLWVYAKKADANSKGA